MAYLVTVADNSGREYLAVSADGRFLLIDENCGACCGVAGCQTAYQFNPCPPPVLIDGSNPGANPDTSDCANTNKPAIYVCSDARCGDTPIEFVDRIRWSGFCYQRGALVVTTAIPAGLQLVDVSEVVCLDDSIDCDHPTCVDGYRRKFVVGVPCPGQNNVPTNRPYFLACLVDACDVINYEGVCYLVSPGAGIDESAVPPGSPRVAVGVTGTNGGKCCTCLPNCTITSYSYQPCDGSPVITNNCCCSQRRKVYLDVYTGFFTSPPFGGPIHIDWFATPGVWEYDDNGTLINQTGGLVTVAEWFQDGTTNTYSFTPQPWLGCGYPADLFQGPTFPALGGVFTGCANEPHFEPMTVSAFKAYGCGSALLDGTWTIPVGDGTQQQRWHALIIWRVEYDGRCSTQCQQTGSAARTEIVTNRKSESRGGCKSCGDAGTKGATI